MDYSVISLTDSRRQPATAAYWTKPDGHLKTGEREAIVPNSSRRSSRISAQRQKEHDLRTHPENNWKPLRKASSQEDSIFFHLPAELRREIYLLILAPSFVPDPFTHPRSANEHSLFPTTLLPLDQPPLTKRRMHLNFLLTCRQIYNEAAILAITSTIYTVSYNGYNALTFPIPREATRLFGRMEPWQLASIRHLHISTVLSRLSARHPGTYISHSVWAELGCLRLPPSKPSHKERGWHGYREGIGGPFPREVTVTIRDWAWYWRNRHRDGMGLPDPEWMLDNKDWANVLGGVETFRLQMEVGSKELTALKAALPSMEMYDFEIGGGQVLRHSKTREWTHKVWSPENPCQTDEEFFTEFTVVEVVWRVCAKQDQQVVQEGPVDVRATFP